MLKFKPVIVGCILLALIAGLHIYQVHTNPCYRVLRLHIIANSDSPSDQAVKLMVRDAVIKTMRPRFSQARTNDEAVKIAQASLPDLQRAAIKVLNNSGKDYSARAVMGRYDFPTRFYGTRVFPTGEYTAVRIVLGSGQGHNWWCVLFPPLCLKDINTARGGSGNIDIRFKSWEMLKKMGSPMSPRMKVTRTRITRLHKTAR